MLDLSHRDFIREADGLAMMSMWRCNMTRFWNGNHFKYLINGHRLLAGKQTRTNMTNVNSIVLPITTKEKNKDKCHAMYCKLYKDIRCMYKIIQQFFNMHYLTTL
jgi:hypothetical protein